LQYGHYGETLDLKRIDASEGAMMNRVAILLVIFITILGLLAVQNDETACAQTTAVNAGSVEQEIVNQEYEWLSAIKNRDRDALNRIIAEDFVNTGILSGGEASGKAAWIRDTLQNIEVDQVDFGKIVVRSYGDTAVFNSIIHGKFRVKGWAISTSVVVTDLWFKQRERWQVVDRHLSLQVTPRTFLKLILMGFLSGLAIPLLIWLIGRVRKRYRLGRFAAKNQAAN
jgi:ketosteroid isomerase-like protein